MKLSWIVKCILESKDENDESYVFSLDDRFQELQDKTDPVEKYNFCKKMEKLSNKLGGSEVAKWWEDKANDIKNKNPGLISGAAPAAPTNKPLNNLTVNGKPVDIESIKFEDIKPDQAPHFSSAYILFAKYNDGKIVKYDELRKLEDDYPDLVKTLIVQRGLDKDPDDQWWFTRKEKNR